ncbi:hypothetical protein L1987_03087 [Smallanthus sonchifolius]|uniref:Uncharacterized protein n=1 Tax=Smallanthus sonchifolius TaxID=185202 RepID=A0ACB9K9M4_9ASTR|nr:hypothetical protein L1987_03087 [Smallanthus sonchifolius]
MTREQWFSILALVALAAAVGSTQAAIGMPPEAAPLIRHFYKVHNTCANVEPFVRHQVQLVWANDSTVAPKLIKLLYADCMVNRVLEARCPGAVSCADILNIAARDAVYFSGGPSYPVFLGRRDGLESKAEWVDFPSPSMSWESTLAYFQSKGLDVQDMATLLEFDAVLDRLYNFNNTGKPDPTMEESTLSYLRKECPPKLKLGVDQQLRYGGDTYDLTDEFASSVEDFKGEFAFSMSRMGGLKVLTGTNGQIRLNCRTVNK